MELSDSDRPVSFGSTSSSASSRDSHGSFGSRMTLVSNSHLGLFNQDKEAGAIKLELIPARPFSSSELQRDTPTGQQNRVEDGERQPRAQRRVDTSGVPQTTADSASSPKLLYVDRVVQEILETERTYVQDLKSIVEDYLDCIRDQTKLPLATEERSALFGNIQDIFHFNSELLQDLENCENDPVAIAECFVSKSEEFHIYTQYCTNYPRSVAVLTECMRNKMLAKFFRERQETLRHSLPLGSYLLKPVQRILKYHLLLHEIENHLDKDTEGYDVVLDAIDTMQRVAWHINDMKRKHEHAVRLQEIQSLLTNWKGPDLTSYGELVLEGTFRIQRAKNECGNLMLVEVIPKEPLSFSVFHYKNPKLQHTVQVSPGDGHGAGMAKSQQDKRLWVLHLKRLILENHAAKIPAKAKQAILEMDAVHHPGFCYSPEGETRAFCGSKEGPAPYRLRRKSDHPGFCYSPEGETRAFCGSKEGPAPYRLRRKSETAQDIQTVSREESSPRLASTGPSPAQRSSQPSTSAIMSVLRRGGAVRNIWTDHQIRQALFPGRRSPQENEDDEDDYQMFVPSFSSSDLNSARLCEDSTSSRPCSWHMGRIESTEPAGSGHRIVRRASSAGESNSCLPEIRIRDSDGSQYSPQRDLQNGPVPGGQEAATPFGSSVELTIDDIDHVYDNISYEDLKLMAAKREGAEPSPTRSARDSVRPKSTPEFTFLKRPASHSQSSLHIRNDGAVSSQEAPIQSTQELQAVEENIYDTIGLPDPPSLDFKCNSLQRSKRSTFLGLEADFVCCDSLRPFVSQDSLQFSEDEMPYQQGPPENDYLSLLCNSSSCNLSLAEKALSDKLSEEVDEIWNDLENYIKKNEDKARDRLLAAFPVSKDDVAGRLQMTSSPNLSHNGACSSSTLSLPGIQAVPTSTMGRAGRVGRANCPFEGDLISKDSSFVSLSRLSLASDMPPMDSPYDLANCSLSLADPEHPDPGMEAADKTKNRVFMMARQYSQKIKKANQLLKVKSPEVEQPPAGQHHKATHKDLAAILEEKKQGGPAIVTQYFSPRSNILKVTHVPFPKRVLLRWFALTLRENARTLTAECSSDVVIEWTASPDFFVWALPLCQELALGVVRKEERPIHLLKLSSISIELSSRGLQAPDQIAAYKSPNQARAFISSGWTLYIALMGAAESQLVLYELVACSGWHHAKSQTPVQGARIAEYSQLYDQIVFRETPIKIQKDGWASPQESSLLRSASPSQTHHGREDWLWHSTYSNGELADFCPQPEQDLKSKYPTSEINTKSTPRQLSAACSVPSLQTSDRLPDSLQRCSVVVSQPNKENSCQGHLYNSLGRKGISAKSQLYHRSQSSSSILINQSTDSISYPSEMEKKQPLSLCRNARCESHQDLLPGAADSCQQGTGKCSDLTLQDSQKILVVNRNLPLNAQIATQNYFSNFKETEGDEDDYVEIKSEEEESELELSHHRRRRSGSKMMDLDSGENLCSGNTPSSLNSPCIPKKSINSKLGLTPYLTSYNDSDKLNDYLWRGPSANQQNIVQSLREKFQCLSSSSFA
ncbi:Pleckstrin homology domain-containing family G member 1 [Tupaia chinensis]|uniref:Pleckstrin homology domain-containing family G member 1 n=1 Tax=Tupaia chinensis TaxID=246437 RepID=L9LFW6_TUPCH|nr:Pleckstrin homology domain-containing family G member 1 [Tupaia chinensis]